MSSLGDTAYVGSLHYESLVPPVSGTNQDLQQVTTIGSTTSDILNCGGVSTGAGDVVATSGDFIISGTGTITTTGSGDMTCALGRLRSDVGGVFTDKISPSVTSGGLITTFTQHYRGKRHFTEIPGLNITDDLMIGEILTIRTGTGSTTFNLPTGEEGMWATIINKSGNNQRLSPQIGGQIDTVGPPGITLLATAPYARDVYCVRANEWWSSNP